LKDKTSKNTELYAYRSDWAIRIVKAIATTLGLIINKITLGAASRKPSPFLIWLTLFLVVDLVIIVTSVVQGTFFPQVDQKRQLLEDSMGVVLFTLSPLIVALIFRFYERLYPTFRMLGKRRVISGEPSQLEELITQIDKRCNSRLWAGICSGVGLLAFGTWLWLLPLMGIREDGAFQSWGRDLPLVIKIYVNLWALMAWFALLFFVYKAMVVLRAIQELSTNNKTATTGPRFSIDLHHPDGCAGLSTLSQLWFNVTYVVVMVGIGVSVYIVKWQMWQNPLVWFEMIGYAFLGSFLFFLPFLRLHSLMKNYKEEEFEKYFCEWQRTKETGSGAKLQRWRKRYEEIKRLPTWPFNWGNSLRVWGIYLLVNILIAILDRVL